MALISFRESQRIVGELASTLRSSREKIKTRDSLHRILFDTVYALRSNPPCELAAMDGIAVNSTQELSVPVRFGPGEWQRINTGDPVGDLWNAVIKIEDVEWENDTAVISKPIAPMQHIRLKGEDFLEGSMLFAAGHKIEAADLSLLLTAGHEMVQVLKKPVVAFLPTGSELVAESAKRSEGSVLETNSAMVAAAVQSWGGIFKLTSPVADDASSLKLAIRQAVADSDVVVVSAGTSMGTRDLTASVIQDLGTMLFHGVALHPSKPVLLARIGDVPILGLPGYPVSAYIASLYFLQPLVTAISGDAFQSRREIHISAEDLPAKNTDTIYRVNMHDVDGRIYVRKIPRGAGSILSLSQMDGLMHVPADTAIHKRDAVRVDIVHDRAANTLAIRGVADPAFDRAWELFKQALPQKRILFWDTPPEEALQNIIERSCHMAIINTFAGYDLFPEFARQLQENMLRYRIFSRTVALAVSNSATEMNTLHDLPNQFRIVIPRRNRCLWTHVVAVSPESSRFQELDINLPDETAIRWFREQLELGVFADIRFLKSNRCRLLEIQEHSDLVVSETYAENPPIKKLIDLLLSPQFGDWITSLRGCNISSRGLLHETYDV